MEDQFGNKIQEKYIFKYKCPKCKIKILQHLTDPHWKGGIYCNKCNIKMEIKE